jgi:hypothetical protein
VKLSLPSERGLTFVNHWPGHFATMAPKTASINEKSKDKSSCETPSSNNEKEEVTQQPMMDAMMRFMTDMRMDIVSKLDAVLARVINVEDTLADHERKFSSVIERIDKIEEKVNGRQKEANEMGTMKEMLAKEVMEMKEVMKRECHIRITGLKEEARENNASLREAVVQIFQTKMEVDGSGSMVLDVFRVGKAMEGKGARPRAVIAKVGSVSQRNHILRGKKNLRNHKELGVDIDRTKEQVEQLKRELAKKKDIQSRGGQAILIKGKATEIVRPAVGRSSNDKESGLMPEEEGEEPTLMVVLEDTVEVVGNAAVGIEVVGNAAGETSDSHGDGGQSLSPPPPPLQRNRKGNAGKNRSQP